MTAPTGPALLFCPADRPERYAKAQVADVVILDLEDAVAPAHKDAARRALMKSALDPATTIVRVNPRASGEQDRDLAALAATSYRTVMVPKAETSGDLAGLGAYDVVALCETPLGVTNSETLAGIDHVVGLTWGAEDLVAAIGGTSSRRADGQFRDVARLARARVLLAAAARGKPAYDTVFFDIADDVGLTAAAEDAAASGFAGAMCIHPRQVPIIRSAFTPTPSRVKWAREILAAAAAAPQGVFAFKGQMVDEPVLRQARHIMVAANLAPRSQGSES